MEPLKSRSGHVECCDGDALILRDMMKCKEMGDLEQPTKDVIAGEDRYVNLS